MNLALKLNATYSIHIHTLALSILELQRSSYYKQFLKNSDPAFSWICNHEINNNNNG